MVSSIILGIQIAALVSIPLAYTARWQQLVAAKLLKTCRVPCPLHFARRPDGPTTQCREHVRLCLFASARALILVVFLFALRHQASE